MSRTSRKRKVAQIEEDLNEDSRPTKKQKITKKSPNNNKNAPKNKAPVIEEDSSDEADVEFIPRKMTKEELKAIALQKLIASNTVNIPRENVEDEESTLPDELLLQIFSHFKRKELTSLGLTCRQWHRLSHDQSLGWYAADSFLLTEHLDSYFKRHQELNIPNPVKPEEYARMWHNQMEVARRYRNAFVQRSYESEPATIRTHTNNNKLMELLNEDAEVIRYVSCEESHMEWDELNADTDLWSYHIRKVSLEEAKEFCKSKEAIKWQRLTDEDLCYWIVDVELNIKRLEQLVAANEAITGLQFIYHVAWQELAQGIKFVSSTKRSSIPRRSFTAQQQPEGFKDEIKLYKYQLDAISWMSSVEQNTEGIPYITAYSLPNAHTDLLFRKSIDNAQLNQPGVNETGRGKNVKVYNKSSNLDEVFDVVVPRGAILADEMGLGKTIEVIGLILSVPPPKKLPEHENLFATRATLVLSPNHLVKQWNDEIAKATNLKVAVIATIAQLKKYTYEDLLGYDVVIVSYQLLANSNYRDFKNRWIEHKSQSFESLRQKTAILEQFYWHRLILDEGHEYITNNQYVRYFESLFTRFAWYVTGTPFPTESKHMFYVKELIGMQYDPVNYDKDHILTDVMLRELYWRHTKESVKGEYKIPEYVEDLVLVEFDEIERAIYASARSDGDEQSRVCGTLLHEKSLDERLVKLIADTKFSIKFYGEKVVEFKTNPAAAQRVPKQYIDICQELAEKAPKVLEMALKATPFAKRDKKTTSTEISKLTLQHGSKMAQMISYLKKLFVRKPDSRVIFFSQFDEMLSGVSQVLTEHNIANVFVEGYVAQAHRSRSNINVRNVWKRTKALTNFKNDEDVKVIMLSLKNAASGTNLVEATHVILMDPVTGSKKEAQAIESQAIGRAFRQGQTKQITIVRFVVRNTIEHALYLRNNDVNEGTTVVVSKDNKPQLVRSSSATMLKRSGSTSNLLSVGNNTNQNMTDD